eukprot:1445756-Ditylum_brightwellii.AAC.1
MATQKRGTCCTGELYKHKNLQLCKIHNCSGCNDIVHLVCAAEDAKADKCLCFKCAPKAAVKQPPPKSANKKAYHERKSSHLCKYNSEKRAPSSASAPSKKRGNVERKK